MANQFGSNPWAIDTPSDDVMYENDLENCQFEYVGYDGTDAVEVQNRVGKTTAFLRGLTNGMTVRSGRIGWIQGLKVPTQSTLAGGDNLKSGRLLVYYE